MKNKVIKIIAIIVIAALVVTGGVFVAKNIKSPDEYYGTTDSALPDENSVTVTFSVNCRTITDEAADNECIPENGEVIKECKISLPSGSTAYDCIIAAAKTCGITVDTDAASSYITGINGIYAGDFGDMSGWLFYANGEMASIGATIFTLSDGDRIEWCYSRNFGEDLK